MAFRRELFDEIGGFDPALDVGTVTRGGGDLEMYYRVLKTGGTLLYEPAALVRHRHRSSHRELSAQMVDWGSGHSAFLTRSLAAYPEERLAVGRLVAWYLGKWHLPRLAAALMRPPNAWRGLVLAELRGSMLGPARYARARRTAAALAKGSVSTASVAATPPARLQRQPGQGTAVRKVDVQQRAIVDAITDAGAYEQVRVYVLSGGCPVGSVNLAHAGRVVAPTRLRDAIAHVLGLQVIGSPGERSPWSARITAMAQLIERIAPADNPEMVPSLPSDVMVSVVVATLDRPADLRRCLVGLTNQTTRRPVELVVVDNHPASGLTAPVVADFPGVRLVREERRGLSYARNAGIVASRGQIVAATDDDVVPAPDWLERLVAPFVRTDVMVVTGLVVPLELETPSQLAFEAYGGLGRGFRRREVGADWFRAYRVRPVPTWELGGTANAAFRASIFTDPAIGLLEESLGAGMPAGVGEDTYMFYKVLKAGHTLVYEPAAYCWHRHRRDANALRRQLYDYSRGHVAYQLTTLIQDHDLRALVQLGLGLPHAHWWRMWEYLRRRSDFPLSLTLLELRGHLAGPHAFWASRRRVRQEGRSQPYAPPTPAPSERLDARSDRSLLEAGA